ncbi:MAG TPA: MBL fold metallo-hydrolase [Candidatus Limnocylindrales bacterium]|nr:MBL fold metallo-hydrolase [Candidatus Limnocylindrales bacterium]
MTPAQILREKVELSSFQDDLFGENCYVLGRRDVNRALVIDPGLQEREVLAFLERRSLQVDGILLSHGHIDHLAGVPALVRATRAPVFMHPADLAIVDFEQFAQYPFIPAGFLPFTVDRELGHGVEVALEDLRLRVLHTPGHTQGSVSFVIGLDCFSGDTLFERGIGRTDLPGGSTEQIVVSIRDVLYRLPPDTIVYPGHGPRTSIRSEMLLNPFVPDLG